MKKLGFGMMRLPQTDPNKTRAVDVDKTRELVDRFMAAGFNYFDTAYVYHGGMSEKLFGELVADRYPRDSFVITTKMPVFLIKNAEDYPVIFQKQLDRCHVDYFDNYLLHSIGKSDYPTIEAHKGFEFLVRMKEEGRAKRIGFSFHDDAETLDRILTDHPEAEMVLLQINYIDWEDASVQSRKCHEVCLKHGIDVAVMEPLKGGMLVNLPEETANILKGVSPDAGFPSWGIRFAASLENVFVVLSGMTTLEQMEDNMSYMADFQPFSEEEFAAVHKVADITRKSIPIPCTACRYCVDDCPHNIAIPEYFALYNNQNQYELIPSHFTTFNNIIAARGKPSDCGGCGQCEAHCPQHLPIIENLKLVAKVFEKA